MTRNIHTEDINVEKVDKELEETARKIAKELLTGSAKIPFEETPQEFCARFAHIISRYIQDKKLKKQ